MIAALFNHKWKILAAAAVLIALRCFWLWQPERQVMLHQQHFLEAAQDRDWAKYYGFFDDGFRMPMGQDKAWTLEQSRTVLGQFITLKISAPDTTVTLEGTTAHVSAVIRVDGSGSELAQAAMTAVNESKAPFEFTWKRASWKPWDWRLTAADHPLMHVSTGLE